MLSPVRTLPSFLRLPHPFSFTDLAGVLLLGEAFLGLPAPDTVFWSSRGHSGLSTDCGDQGQIRLHLNQKAAPIYSVTSDRSCLIVCISKMKGIPTYMVVIRIIVKHVRHLKLLGPQQVIRSRYFTSSDT